MKKVKYILWIALMAILVAACGGKQEKTRTEKMIENEEDVDLVAHLTGINEGTPVAYDEQSEEQPGAEQPKSELASTDEDNIGGSQGAFIGTMKIGEEEVRGTFTVRKATASNEVVMENVRSGKEIRLDPGQYDFVFTTDKIVGSPEFTLRDVEIEAGRRIKRPVRIPVGEIKLVTGGRCAKKPIKIRLKGATDWYPGKFYTCQKLKLMAGEYDAEIVSGRHRTPISGIQVYDGGTRDVLIRNQ